MITTEQILCTPEYAKELLALSGGNRTINPRYVDGLVRDIKTGNWGIGDTIKIDEKNVLFDGHHRLTAISLSGISCEILLTRGLPSESRNYSNLARPWKLNEISTQSGEAFSQRHFGVAKFIEFGAIGTGTTASTRQITYTENRALVLKHEAVLNFVIKRAGHTKYISVPVLAVMARAAYYPGGLDRIEHFMEVLGTGIQTYTIDANIILLRNWMIELQAKGSCPQRHELYKRTEKALWMYLKNKPMKASRPAPTEMFPLTTEANGDVVPK